jgi:hypothetical protein
MKPVNGKMIMKRQDLMTMTTVALGTATLTVAAFLSGPIGAGSDTDALSAKIAKPKFVSHGVEMTLVPAGNQVFRAGDQPAFELTAVNTASQPVSVSACVSMTASSPEDMMSRAVRLPELLWQQVELVILKPNETRVIALSANKSLPANSMIAVSLRDADQDKSAANTVAGSPDAARATLSQVARMSMLNPGVAVLTFSTATPAKQPVVAVR